MVCLPLIERELRVAVRKQRPARGRLKVAALAAGGSMLFLLFGALASDHGAGRGLEKLLCLAGLCFVLQAPALTAGVLAGERRNQTLGLLFLSGLGAVEVFASKFLSSALIAFTNLLAIFPMLALPFLIGRVSYDLFLAIICGLPTLMLFVLAVSLLASVLTRDDGTAVILANVLGALLCVLAPAIYLAESHFSPGAKPSLWWLRLSPAYGPYLAWGGFNSGFRAVERAEFWQNLPLKVGWSALALSAAAFALKRIWREQEAEEGSGGWRGRWREFLHGGRESRQRLGRSWLGENPFVWLAGRDRQPAMLGWLVVGGIVLAWLLCWAVWRAEWPSVPNFIITAALLNSVLAWLTRHTAAQEIGRGRWDGSFELLLTTALSPDDIVHGTLKALRWHFRELANFVLSLNVLMMIAGLMARRWNTGALFVYSCIWLILLTWTWSLGHYWSRLLAVMWASLNCGRPAYAVWRSSGLGFSGTRWWYWIWMWNLYNFRFFGRGFQRFPTGSSLEVIFASVAVVFCLILFAQRLFASRGEVRDFKWDAKAMDWLAVRYSKSAAIDRFYESRLINEFRAIVRQPLPDPSDKRFKKWNARERFPSDSDLARQQLHEQLMRRYREPG